MRREHNAPHPERPHWHWDAVFTVWRRPHPPIAPYGLVVPCGDDSLVEIDKADALYPLDPQTTEMTT